MRSWLTRLHAALTARREPKPMMPAPIDDPDLIPVPPDEAGHEDYVRYQAALIRQAARGHGRKSG